jgi:hypothetical protein
MFIIGFIIGIISGGTIAIIGIGARSWNIKYITEIV